MVVERERERESYLLIEDKAFKINVLYKVNKDELTVRLACLFCWLDTS